MTSGSTPPNGPETTADPSWRRHGYDGDAGTLVAAGTLPRAWTATWAQRPEALLLRDERTPWLTAGGFDARTREIAARYDAAGLTAGDRILMSAGASVDLAVAHVAALRLGLVVVPVNTAFGERELTTVIDAARPGLVVLDDPARLPRAESVTAAIDRPDPASGHVSPPLDAAGRDDTALLVFTSGTTGTPKGVPLTHGNLLASSESVRIAWRWTATDRLFLALPLFHIHGLGVGLHGTLLAGASAVIRERFDTDDAFDTIATEHCTLVFGVPTMWVRYAASPRVAELQTLRLCVSGSAPLSPDVFETLAQRGGQRVLERYGMSETGMLTSNPLDGDRRPGSVGFALPGVDTRLRAVGEDGTGEICVRGPNVFPGYLDRPEATAEAFEDGWFRTGDLGRLDDDGFLRIVGRSKELIITGGYNVYPRDIEELLREHPRVADVAVIGVPDPEWGERVVACVVPAGQSAVSAGDAGVLGPELTAWAAERLAGYKRPRIVRFLDELPRNAMGKVIKSALQ
jgi:malonyl-CoA/methylmalonyl-CoA synthetase